MSQEWPLSAEERMELEKQLSQSICMETLIGKYADIRSVYADGFTHQCICPNKNHKGGAERTPSFYFSEADKRFHCYGCKIHGSPFDFISLMTGVRPDIVMDQFAKEQGFIMGQLPPAQVKFPIVDLNYDLSIKLRDYLVKLKGTSNYDTEKLWVDNVFMRMDERFSKLKDTDFVEARAYYAQILMDLERRL